MTDTNTKQEYTIDATGQRLGRVASEIAVLLMGKQLPDFQRNTVPNVSVTVSNASLLDITNKKREQKTYNRYSGYPGGLKTQRMEEVIEKKGYEAVLTNAIAGMLPANKLRPLMLKNLTINE